ncbi:MAG TPA: M20 family metallopeptidase, partial [Terriglobia bacterium]|nr:M20 family metallopeptidase [Terriglobia bacterium]
MKPNELSKYCQDQLSAMMRCLKKAVEIESPSNSKPHVDRVAKFFAEEFKRAGAKVSVLPHATAGSAVAAEFWPEAGKTKPILLLGHLDTVWDAGTLKRMPFKVVKGCAYGPGVMDMKAGIVIGLWAVRALQALQTTPRSAVQFLLTPDEEISSMAFREEIQNRARGSRAVLVLEPALGGALKTARKGVVEYKITVHGRSAHAGINPRDGVNAINELARQLLRVEKFARRQSGITLNVGVIAGGTRTNMIPDLASAVIDARIPRAKDRNVVEWKIRGLTPIDPQTRVEVEGGINRPPLERKMSVDLFRTARRLGMQLGMDIRETSTGGGSDGNFTAALGIPTLDGLGAV